MTSNGTNLIVSDRANARVLIWNTFPTTSHAAADTVLGQAGFTTATQATTQAGMKNPAGLHLNGTDLFVMDGANSRGLIFQG